MSLFRDLIYTEECLKCDNEDCVGDVRLIRDISSSPNEWPIRELALRGDFDDLCLGGRLGLEIWYLKPRLVYDTHNDHSKLC